MSDNSPKSIAKAFYDAGMGCNCDLDNWEPERTTGHSRVCRIHRAAMDWRDGDPYPVKVQRQTPTIAELFGDV